MNFKNVFYEIGYTKFSIPFINDIRNERILEIFRSARNPIKPFNMSARINILTHLI